jgi:hypothetical protein
VGLAEAVLVQAEAEIDTPVVTDEEGDAAIEAECDVDTVSVMEAVLDVDAPVDNEAVGVPITEIVLAPDVDGETVPVPARDADIDGEMVCDGDVEQDAVGGGVTGTEGEGDADAPYIRTKVPFITPKEPCGRSGRVSIPGLGPGNAYPPAKLHVEVDTLMAGNSCVSPSTGPDHAIPCTANVQFVFVASGTQVVINTVSPSEPDVKGTDDQGDPLEVRGNHLVIFGRVASRAPVVVFNIVTESSAPAGAYISVGELNKAGAAVTTKVMSALVAMPFIILDALPVDKMDVLGHTPFPPLSRRCTLCKLVCVEIIIRLPA